jgi:hypothetical protein
MSAEYIAIPASGWYAFSVHPVINTEEFIGKTVGRRIAAHPLRLDPNRRNNAGAWRSAGMTPRIPKGVYRFHSHEEADQWLMDHLTRRPGN